MGIEPTLFAWEAKVLPLNDTREACSLLEDVTHAEEFDFHVVVHAMV
jgi:hypothetical protein